jgi:plastocyanin
MFTMNLAVLALIALQGCSDAEPQPSARESSTPNSAVSPSAEEPTEEATEATTQPSSKKVKAEVIDTEFKPVSIEVKVGSSVDWVQIGDQPHSVSAVDGSFDSSPDCGPLDSDMCLGEGDTFSYTFEKPGEFDYYCRVHGLPDGTGMFGTVVVK